MTEVALGFIAVLPPVALGFTAVLPPVALNPVATSVRSRPLQALALRGSGHARRRTMLHILGWILAGLVIGALAKLLHPGKDPGGMLITIALGIGGALIGGFLGRAVGWYGPDENAGFIVSIIGAVVLLAIYTAVVRRRGSRLGYSP